MQLDYNKFDRTKFKVDTEEFSLDFSVSFSRLCDLFKRDKENAFGNPVIELNIKCKPTKIYDIDLRKYVIMDHHTFVLGEFEYDPLKKKWIFKFDKYDCGDDHGSSLSYAQHAKLAKFIESKDVQSRLKKLSQYLI